MVANSRVQGRVEDMEESVLALRAMVGTTGWLCQDKGNGSVLTVPKTQMWPYMQGCV